MISPFYHLSKQMHWRHIDFLPQRSRDSAFLTALYCAVVKTFDIRQLSNHDGNVNVKRKQFSLFTNIEFFIEMCNEWTNALEVATWLGSLRKHDGYGNDWYVKWADSRSRLRHVRHFGVPIQQNGGHIGVSINLHGCWPLEWKRSKSTPFGTVGCI